jgi:hypothetical protein
MATILRYFGVIGFFAAALFAPQLAHATGEACVNDIDCKTGPTCGGEICDWTKLMTCQPASATGSGSEGWCSVDTDCKCKADGATCDKTMFQCTKTTNATGSGGASGTGGSAGASAAGTSSTAGSSSSSSSSSSGGCSVASGIPRGSWSFALGAACAVGLLGARRRRRAVG